MNAASLEKQEVPTIPSAQNFYQDLWDDRVSTSLPT
jgi:hypothetical protein